MAGKKKTGGKLVRIVGAHKEAISGIGYTIRDVPFMVKDPAVYAALLSQELRFQAPRKTSSTGTEPVEVED